MKPPHTMEEQIKIYSLLPVMKTYLQILYHNNAQTGNLARQLQPHQIHVAKAQI